MSTDKEDTSDYQPIDCNFYDRIEAAIVQRKQVRLQYQGEAGEPVEFVGRLLDTRVADGEEFLKFGEAQEIRMDRIIALDGVVLAKSC